MTKTVEVKTKVVDLINRWVAKEKITMRLSATSDFPFCYLKPQEVFTFIDELQKDVVTEKFAIFKGIIVINLEEGLELVLITE